MTGVLKTGNRHGHRSGEGERVNHRKEKEQISKGPARESGGTKWGLTLHGNAGRRLYCMHEKLLRRKENCTNLTSMPA